tara:strand:+ start:7363 stop:7581 length:219 start_codon:yes stop_codon:yes gene_type:complete
MDIRKISIGADYKSGAMHYIVGQPVLSSSHTIHLIQFYKNSYRIWVQREDEIYMWKEFLDTLPISLEYNINF